MCVWTRHVEACLVAGDEAGLEHGLDGSSVLIVSLLLLLDTLELLLEAIDGSKLVLDSLLLSQCSDLLVLDLLLGASPLTADLHTIEHKIVRVKGVENGIVLEEQNLQVTSCSFLL